eukprot:GHVU01073712.1.p1 GENE.GHVU01073712.1~~GHVU01073712.1.p1  ORF type:complete len:165 (+),score=9.73 GHVU01073712.1:169-663(+)
MGKFHAELGGDEDDGKGKVAQESSSQRDVPEQKLKKKASSPNSYDDPSVCLSWRTLFEDSGFNRYSRATRVLVKAFLVCWLLLAISAGILLTWMYIAEVSVTKAPWMYIELAAKIVIATTLCYAACFFIAAMVETCLRCCNQDVRIYRIFAKIGATVREFVSAC